MTPPGGVQRTIASASDRRQIHVFLEHGRRRLNDLCGGILRRGRSCVWQGALDHTAVSDTDESGGDGEERLV